MLAGKAFFLAASILVFSLVLVPFHRANAIIDITGDATIPKETGHELRLIVKLLKTVSKLESQGKLNGTEVSVPITLIMPIDVEGQNAQICVALLSSGDMTCQQVIINSENQTVSIASDATSNETSPSTAMNGTRGTTIDDSTREIMFVIKFLKAVPRLDAKGELNITSITIPITFIVPINVDSETSQICLSILSSGDMNCQQIIISEDNQTATMVPVTDNTTLTASGNTSAPSSGESNLTDTAGEETTDDSEAPNGSHSDELCVTPCPPDQYCVQMCQPTGDNTTNS